MMEYIFKSWYKFNKWKTTEKGKSTFDAIMGGVYVLLISSGIAILLALMVAASANDWTLILPEFIFWICWSFPLTFLGFFIQNLPEIYENYPIKLKPYYAKTDINGERIIIKVLEDEYYNKDCVYIREIGKSGAHSVNKKELAWEWEEPTPEELKLIKIKEIR